MYLLLVIILLLAPVNALGQSVLRTLPEGPAPGGSFTLRYQPSRDLLKHPADSLVAEVLFAGPGPAVLDIPLRREGRWFVGSRDIPVTARTLFVRIAVGDITDDRNGH